MRIRFRNLRVSLPSVGGEALILRDLSLEVGQGEFLALAGPSGCGKTTLLGAIAGLVRPREGDIQRILTAADTNQRVLLVPQRDSLFPWMTVLENAAFGLEMQGVEKGACAAPLSCCGGTAWRTGRGRIRTSLPPASSSAWR
jgi:ABC-type nitrate/sulfonate/bicarbonate transport system ATPase subunit